MGGGVSHVHFRKIATPTFRTDLSLKYNRFVMFSSSELDFKTHFRSFLHFLYNQPHNYCKNSIDGKKSMKTCSTDSRHLRKCIISWRLISEPLQNSINLVLAQNEYISSFEKKCFLH